MFLFKEIGILRKYLESGEINLWTEEQNIDERVEGDIKKFSSNYSGPEVDESVKSVLRAELRDMYTKVIEKKKAVLAEIKTKNIAIEQKYLNDSI